jgi:hypothetical protein
MERSDGMIPWYCEANRDHLHSTQWEAKACSELYELWQIAVSDLNNRVRADEVEHAVNLALSELDSSDLED